MSHIRKTIHVGSPAFWLLWLMIILLAIAALACNFPGGYSAHLVPTEAFLEHMTVLQENA